MKWFGLDRVLLGVAALCIASTAWAVTILPPKPQVDTPRLYVMDCGTITNDMPEIFQLTRDEVSNTIMANMCFLVVHPKGTLLFDTGITDRWVGRPLGENQSNKHVAQLKMNTLVGQLADIGYTPGMIDYLVLSHHHYDHSGNANAFARTATWLVPKQERDVMFEAGEPKRGFEDYYMLKDAKTVFIGQEHDVFGDGTVIVRQTPGHSPGHVVLQARLKDTGHVILGGDLYHYPEEITLNRMPKREETSGTPESRAMVLDLAKKLQAQIWIAHDFNLFRRIRRVPAFYD